jgi:hypothetical protein
VYFLPTTKENIRDKLCSKIKLLFNKLLIYIRNGYLCGPIPVIIFIQLFLAPKLLYKGGDVNEKK